MNIRIILSTILSLSLSSFALAEVTWNSEAEVGVVITGGNSETQTANGKISATRESDKWKDTGKIEGLNASSTDAATDTETTTAEKYSANFKADYKLSKANFLFGTADYVDDRFSGFDYQATIAFGYGRIIMKNDKQGLEAEIGPGIRYFKVSYDEATDTRFESDSESIVHMAAKYHYNFTEQAVFTQEVTVDAGDDATVTESITALKAQIVNKLAMKASFKARSTSEVPEGADKTDTETALTLVYSF